MRIFRLIKIIYIFKRYGLLDIIKESNKTSIFSYILQIIFFIVPKKYPYKSLPVRLKLAFEELGPVFIKFGQLLSTRQDLIPLEYVVELSKLQNQVKPFSGKIAQEIVTQSLKLNINDVFCEFSPEAVAAASIAQVHKARLKHNNLDVAVKILRPNIKNIITADIKLLHLVAWCIEKLFKDGKRLKPQEVITEFSKVIFTELDFMQEAANANELRRLHMNDKTIIIPKIYFDYSNDKIIVLEWMDGTPITDLKTLKEKGIDLKQLSHNGVEIFYTQVFNYGFFHADMHPGNILCDNYGRYIGLDFGIIGCLSENDKRYLAINILAFFNRDYKKVAITHIESGWAPKNTSIEELENAIRAVCEPIFNKPLAQISFGQVLIKLFQVSKKFNISIQPQLLLLQKTIVNVEGLGRLLNPHLDLWVTAKPILEKWMKQQTGIRGLLKNIKDELPYYSYLFPKIPRLYIKSINDIEDLKTQNSHYISLLNYYKKQNLLFLGTILCLGAIIALILY